MRASSRSIAVVVMAACVLVGASRPAAAAGNEDVARAKEHFEAATKAFGLGRYGEAADNYEKAYGYKSDPALLYNAAQAYRLAGNKPRALELYRNYQRLYSRKGVDVSGRIADLEKAIAEEEAQKAALPPPADPEPPVGTGSALPSAPPEATASSAATTGPSRPLTKRPVFWVAIGSAVLVIAGATFLATRPDRAPDPGFGSVGVP